MLTEMSGESRRAFLTSSGAVATGAVTALAGCVDDLTDFESGEDPEDDEDSLPSFHQWLYAPEEVGLGAYSYTYYDAEAVVDDPGYGSTLEAYGMDHVTETIESYTPLDLSLAAEAVSIDYETEGASGIAVTGEFDRDDLPDYEGTAEQDDEFEKSEYGAYDVYADDEIAHAIRTDPESVVVSAHVPADRDASGREVVETMIDARNGDARRLSAADDAVDAVLRQQGGRTIAFGGSAGAPEVEPLFDPEGDAATVEAAGVSVGGDDDPPYRVTVVTDDPVADVDEFGAELQPVVHMTEPSVTEDETVLIFEPDTEDDPEEKESGPSPAQFDVDIQSDRAIITHAGGEEIPADELEIGITGGGSGTWDTVGQTEIVAPGDSVEIPLSEHDHGETLELEWLPESEILISEEITAQESADEPQATFSVDFPADDLAMIAHQGGDEIPADELYIYTTGGVMDPWQTYSGDSVVSPGDVIEVPHGDPGGEIGLEWAPGPTLLHSEQIPEQESADEPDASFDIQYPDDSDDMQIFHTGGDEIPANELLIHIQADDHYEIPWEELATHEMVSEGNYVELPHEEEFYDGTLTVEWIPGSTTLDQTRIHAGH